MTRSSKLDGWRRTQQYIDNASLQALKLSRRRYQQLESEEHCRSALELGDHNMKKPVDLANVTASNTTVTGGKTETGNARKSTSDKTDNGFDIYISSSAASGENIMADFSRSEPTIDDCRRTQILSSRALNSPSSRNCNAHVKESVAIHGSRGFGQQTLAAYTTELINRSKEIRLYR